MPNSFTTVWVCEGGWLGWWAGGCTFNTLHFISMVQVRPAGSLVSLVCRWSGSWVSTAAVRENPHRWKQNCFTGFDCVLFCWFDKFPFTKYASLYKVPNHCSHRSYPKQNYITASPTNCVLWCSSKAQVKYRHLCSKFKFTGKKEGAELYSLLEHLALDIITVFWAADE